LTSFGTQRAEAGFPPFAFADPVSRLSPDQLMWRPRSASALDPDAGTGETRLPPASFVQPQVLPVPRAAQPEDSAAQD